MKNLLRGSAALLAALLTACTGAGLEPGSSSIDPPQDPAQQGPARVVPCAEAATRLGGTFLRIANGFGAKVEDVAVGTLSETPATVTLKYGARVGTAVRAWAFTFERNSCRFDSGYALPGTSLIALQTTVPGQERTQRCEPAVTAAAVAAYTSHASLSYLSMDEFIWDGFSADGKIEAFSVSFENPFSAWGVYVDAATCEILTLDYVH